MDFLLALAWLAIVSVAMNHIKDEYRKSRGRHVKAAEAKAAPGELSRPKRSAAVTKHALSFWTREAMYGFPITRAGLSEGWQAHQAEHAKHRAARDAAAERYTRARRALNENAIREHAAGVEDETDEFSRLNHDVIEAEQGVPLWRQRQISKRIARELGYWERMKEPPTRRVDGQPETEADTRFFDRRESGYTGPLDRNGNIPDPSDPQTARALDALQTLQDNTHPQEGTRMATATDTNYTQSLQMAKEVEAEADAAVNDIRWQQMASQVDAIGALMRGDTATLSDAADVADALQEQKKAMEQTRDSAQSFASNLQRRHGGIKEAHDDAPVPAAEAEFYED